MTTVGNEALGQRGGRADKKPELELTSPRNRTSSDEAEVGVEGGGKDEAEGSDGGGGELVHYR